MCIGGIVFKRYAKVYETFIRKNEDVTCKSIIGYDCNSFYVYAISDLLPIIKTIRQI